MSYIGDKKIKEIKATGEKTPGEVEIVKVIFENDKEETLSKLLYDKIISEKPCDATTLREKRIYPVVEAILMILRDWGIKLGELSYMSAVLNQSLAHNEKEALKELWKQYIPEIQMIEDVDLIAVDRVLKAKKQTLKEILNETK